MFFPTTFRRLTFSGLPLFFFGGVARILAAQKPLFASQPFSPPLVVVQSFDKRSPGRSFPSSASISSQVVRAVFFHLSSFQSPWSPGSGKRSFFFPPPSPFCRLTVPAQFWPPCSRYQGPPSSFSQVTGGFSHWRLPSSFPFLTLMFPSTLR